MGRDEGNGIVARLGPLIVLAVAAAVSLPMLGSSGFSKTEGHRVIPGWQMAGVFDAGSEPPRPHVFERGAAPVSHPWWTPKMFGRSYLRKPPGVPIAIGASALVFGPSELSARLPSAIAFCASCLLAYLFARVWFGARWATWAGLGLALMPLAWSPARSAEIESIHNLGVQAAALGVLALGLGVPPKWWQRGLIAALTLAGALVMVMTKGPAGVPVVVAAALAGPVMSRRLDLLGPPMVVLGWLIAVVTLGPFWAAHNDPRAVVESVGGFLWRPDRLAGIALLIPAAFAAALPVSAALLWPIGRDARREAERDADGGAPARLRIARAVALAWLGALVIYTIAGVSNARYAMPAAWIVSPVLAYVARAWLEDGPARLAGARRRITNIAMLGSRWAWPAVLVAAAAVYVPMSEARRESISGRKAGVEMADAIGRELEVLASRRKRMGVVLVADGVVEARPETLLYASRALAAAGATVRGPFWSAGLTAVPVLGAEWHFLAVRTDGGGDERPTLRSAGIFPGLKQIAEVRVHNYTFAVFAPWPPDESSPVDGD